MKVKDLRKITKSNGLKKFEFMVNGFSIEVIEDDCEDLTDFEDLTDLGKIILKKVDALENNSTIEVIEDKCGD